MAASFPTKANWAAGDVLTASALDDLAGTVNLLSPVGQTNGSTLVANSSNASGLGWNQNFAAGKNKIINGDFGVWQRGTSFTPAASAGTFIYTADRFLTSRDGTGATVTVSQQAFTPGTAPVSGYEARYFYRYAQSVAGSGGTYLTICSQLIEGLGLANQTVIYSFWAKADSARTIGVGASQYFGTGGSTTVYTATQNVNLTTSWARYSVTIAVPSIAGKTIGTGQVATEFFIGGTANTVQTYDIWGVQVEVGSVATAFQTATGTVQGELAACQRYYYRNGNGQTYSRYGLASYSGTTSGLMIFNLPVTMRALPTSVDYANLGVQAYGGAAIQAVTAVTLTGTGASGNVAELSVVSGTGYAAGVLAFVNNNNNAAGYIGVSAEL